MSVFNDNKQPCGPIFLCALLFSSSSLAVDDIPLPFLGAYASSDSTAWQQVSSDEWQAIPQDVDMLITHEGDIIQLTVHINVHADPEISSERVITNRMWLASKPTAESMLEPGRVDFDVYKLNAVENRFVDLGDGYCKPQECRYTYVSEKQQQRYDSHLTWDKEQVGKKFNQRGGLSSKAPGESEWKMFKKWNNDFSRKAMTIRF